MTKRQNITEAEIKLGLSEGRYREDGTLIRNTTNGEIVKIVRREPKSENGVPATFIQVNNTVVYQYDYVALIEELSVRRQAQSFSDLEERYGAVLQYAAYFSQYGDKYLAELLRTCLDVVPAFSVRIDEYASSIDIKKIELLDISYFCGSLDAYIKVLGLMLISTYKLHGNNLSNDKIILCNIETFEKCIRDLYEQLMATSNYIESQNRHMVFMNSSIYAMYFFHSGYDIAELERVAKQDRRFRSATAVMEFFKRHHKTGVIDAKSSNVAIGVSAEEILPSSNRNKLAIKILMVLEDIERLKRVRGEMIETAGSDIGSVELAKAVPSSTSEHLGRHNLE